MENYASEMKQGDANQFYDQKEMYTSVYLDNKLHHAESTMRILMERLQRTEAMVGFLRDKLNHAAAHHAVVMQENFHLRHQLSQMAGGNSASTPRTAMAEAQQQHQWCYITPRHREPSETTQAATDLLSIGKA